MTISLAALEAADKAATPGEWTAVLDATGESAWVEVPSRVTVCQWATKDDADLIALYRNETPKLVAALRAVLALADYYDSRPNWKPWGIGFNIRKAITDAGVTP